jgi:hypothetical protein
VDVQEFLGHTELSSAQHYLVRTSTERLRGLLEA